MNKMTFTGCLFPKVQLFRGLTRNICCHHPHCGQQQEAFANRMRYKTAALSLSGTKTQTHSVLKVNMKYSP